MEGEIMIDFKQEKTEQAFRKLLEAWKAEDFKTCKKQLIYICKSIPSDDLAPLLLTSIDTAMGLIELFVKTGLDNVCDQTPASVFYLRLVRYILENEPPALKQVFQEMLTMPEEGTTVH